MTGDDQVACVTSSRRPRTPTASGDTRAGSASPAVAPRARPAQGLRVPEAADLVARRHLPGDTAAGVLERPVGVLAAGSKSGAYSHFAGSPAFRL